MWSDANEGSKSANLCQTSFNSTEDFPFLPSSATPPMSCFKLAAQEDFFAQKLMRRNTVLENHQNSLILQLYELSPHDYSMSLWSKL